MSAQSDATAAKVALWERHGQTVMLAIVTATLMFTGRFMWSVNAQLGEIVSENKYLALQVARLEGSITTMQNNFITRNEFNPYAERIRNLETAKK